MDNQYVLRMIAMISLIIIGIINVFQGLWYMAQQRVGKLPDMMKTIGIINIIIGAVAFGFAAMYAYLMLY